MLGGFETCLVDGERGLHAEAGAWSQSETIFGLKQVPERVDQFSPLHLIFHLFLRTMKRFSTHIVRGAHSIRHIAGGSQHLARAVEATLGPGGRTVVIDPFDPANFNTLSAYPQPQITKDGVSVAKAISFITNTRSVQIG